MLNFIYIVLSLGFIFLNPLSIVKSNADVPEDFRAMLKNSTAPAAKDESFSTHVTRPFIANQEEDTAFFSAPQAYRTEWNNKYKAWIGKDENIDAFTAFKTMGISRQGLQENGHYKNISKAQAKGILQIITGDLGFQNRSCAYEEEAFIARELLRIGYSMPEDEFNSELGNLRNVYNLHQGDLKIKQHLQLAALFLLRGHHTDEAEWYSEDEWYLNGISNTNAVLEKVIDYKEKLDKENRQAALKKMSERPRLTAQEILDNYLDRSRILALYVGEKKELMKNV